MYLAFCVLDVYLHLEERMDFRGDLKRPAFAIKSLAVIRSKGVVEKWLSTRK